MIAIDQTVLRSPDDSSGPPGNCFAACIASILECSIDDVPQPTEDERDAEGWVRPGGYWERLGAWLLRAGFYLVDFGPHRPWTTLDLDTTSEHTYWIANGDGPRGCKHSVVVRVGDGGMRMEHDPHPSRAGLALDEAGNQRVSAWSLLVPIRVAGARTEAVER